MSRRSGRDRGWKAGPRRASLAIAMLIAWVGVPGGAGAAETRWWVSDRPADYAEAEARGVQVGLDGALRLGLRTESESHDSLSTIWAIALLQDGSVAIAADGGRIERWSAGQEFRLWVKLPVGQVLSLLRDGDDLFAGTGPEGLIYRIGLKGDTTRLITTGERYVWSLAAGRSGVFYAGTGTRGKILRIERGSMRVVLDTEESNIVSLVADGAGGVFAGGDSRGRIFHVRPDGSNRTVFEASESEVRSLVIGTDGALHAAALSATAVTQAPANGDEGESATSAPAPVRSPVSGGSAVVYRIFPDSMSAPAWKSPQPFVYALAWVRDGLVAATGNRAGLYRLDPVKGAVQWLAAPQGQITALAVAPDGRIYAASSNPAALWRVGPDAAPRGELSSKVFDAGRMARFGRLLWRGDGGGGRVAFYSRSGNSANPDTGWSQWEGGETGPDGNPIRSPSARYLQWKLVLTGGAPRIESVEVAWREQNLPPVISALEISPQGIGFREGDLTPHSSPITQLLPGGRKVEYSLRRDATTRELRALPSWARGLRTVQWTASDPNGDPLRYRIDVRRENLDTWTELAKDLDAVTHTWDTSGLPDGRYRLRIEASDAGGNAIGEERTDQIISEPFTIDNTPPKILSLDARPERGALWVTAEAEDELSVLSRFELSFDDQPWRPVTPEGGLADRRRLSIRVKLDSVQAGDHTISLRVVDRAGNSASRAVRVTVRSR